MCEYCSYVLHFIILLTIQQFTKTKIHCTLFVERRDIKKLNKNKRKRGKE